MEKKKFFKMVVICFWIFFIAIVQHTVSNAETAAEYFANNPSGTYNMDHRTLIDSSKEIYCLNHGRSRVYGPMILVSHIRIEGDTAIDVTNGIGRKVTHKLNKRIAYIVGGGNPSDGLKGHGPGKNEVTGSTPPYSTRQRVLWINLNDYFSQVLIPADIFLESEYEERSWIDPENNRDAEAISKQLRDYDFAFEQEAIAYENSDTTGAEIKQIDTTPKQNGELIGPFKVQYKGEISSVVINDKNGNPINNGLSITLDKDDKSAYVPAGWKELPSDTDFYIKNWNNKKDIGSIDIKVSSKVLNADLYFFRSKNDDNPAVQRMVSPSYEWVNVEKSVNIKVDVKRDTEIIIKKVDSATGNALKNAQFVLRHNNKLAHISGNSVGEWIDNSDNEWTAEKEDCVFAIPEGGLKLKLEDDGNTLYALTEMNAPGGYELSTLDLYGRSESIKPNTQHGNSKGMKINDPAIKIDGNKNGSSFYFDITPGNNGEITLSNKGFTELTIKKVDSSTGNPLKNAQFVLRHNNKLAHISGNSVGEWIDNSDNEWTAEKEDCVFAIPEGGLKLKLENDGNSLYSLTEMNAPNGYDLSSLGIYSVGNSITPNTDYGDRYGIKLNDERAFGGSSFYFNLTPGTSKTDYITFSNKKDGEQFSVEGYVWEDVTTGKVNERNNLYDEGSENLVSGVKVLLKYGDEIAKDVNGKDCVIEAKDMKGTYKFENIVQKGNLDNYHVVFEYEGIGYDYGTVEINKDNIRGSKAGIDCNNSKYNQTYTARSFKLSDFGSDTDTTYYDSEQHLYKNINLGIYKIDKSARDALTSQLEYVKMVVNGHVYLYEYGDEGTIVDDTIPIKYQSHADAKVYSRPFYPTDLYYRNANGGSGLEVYVVYGVTVTNQNTDEYEEHYELKSLTNVYDSSRYELCTENIQTEEDEHLNGNATYGRVNKDDFGKWSGSNGNIAYNFGTSHKEIEGYKCKIGNEEVQESGMTIDKGRSETKYLQFKVTDNALDKFIENVNNEEFYETYPTQFFANGCHYRHTPEGHIQNDKEEVHDRYYHTNDIIRKDNGIFIKFELCSERTAVGTIFEDATPTSGDILGDGLYKESEDKLVEGVKIELLEAGSETIAQVYNEDDSGAVGTGKATDAVTESSSDGTYSLEGVIPGTYVLRFKYPDGTTKIRDTSGNDLGDVKANDYKSTIISEETVKAGFKGENNSNDWYRAFQYEGNDKFSVAIDNLKTRAEFNEKYWNYKYNGGGTEPNDPIDASTLPFRVKVENTVDNFDKGLVGKVTLKGLNFGICKQPVQQAKFEKVITNIKLTSNTGNVIFDGNPQTKNMPGVADLDYIDNGGSIYTKAEVEESNIYASNYEVTYELRVTNDSQNNYYEEGISYDEEGYGYYYMFGENYNNKAKGIQLATKVQDNLDHLLEYDSSGNNAVIEKVETTTSEKSYHDNHTFDPYILRYKNYMQINDTETVVFKANKALSETQREWNFYNDGEIKVLRNTSDNGDGAFKEDDTNPDEVGDITTYTTSIALARTPDRYGPDWVQTPLDPNNPDEPWSPTETIITSPTGMDKQTIVNYTIATTILLVISAVGIIIIKKKVI